MNRALTSAISILLAASALLWLSYQALESPAVVDGTPVVENIVTNTSSVVVPPSVLPPTLPTPTGLTVSAVGTTSAKLSWQAVSTEGESAIVYQVWRNGEKLATLNRTQFLDVFLVPGQELSYAIVAASVGGAVSDPSSIARITLPTTSGPVVVTPSPTPAPKPTTNTNKPSTTPSTNTGTTKNTNTTPTPTPKPTPTPTPTPVLACGSGGACTAADVAKHGTRANCWVYLSPLNKVYNITPYVSNGNTHPGGDVIAQYCGQNIYSYFMTSANGGKKHSSSALNSVLQAYYLAPFQP